MNTKTILEEHFLVSSADVDFTRTLRLSSLTNFLIQAAWKHAEILGFGMDFLHSNQLVWVLSRLQIKLYNRPYWNNGIKVITWPKGIHRLFYLRDMEVQDNDGNCIAKATTQWLIVNMPTKRPKLYNPESNIFNENLDKHAIDNIDLSVATPEGIYQEFNFSPRYSDIDLNQHLTTTSYIDWMMNSFEMEELKELSVKELKLNFLKEIPYGTAVKIQRKHTQKEKCYYFNYCSEDEKLKFFEAELIVS